MSKQTDAPQPHVMPVDRAAWARELNLSNFVNAYYQWRDINACDGVKSILIIGPGQGLDTVVFRWRGFEVTTFDIDDVFEPDVIGSCHHMPMFNDGQFDAVIASHVLEHLPLHYLDAALAEIARIGRHALIYLPMNGRFSQIRVLPGFLGIDISVVMSWIKFWDRPDGLTAKYCAGQHYWEVGLPGFRISNLIRRFGMQFDVVTCYRNRDWLPSQNFVLRSRRRS